MVRRGVIAVDGTQLPEASPGPVRRIRLRVRGVVQGVGFRPFVFSLAGRYRLAGFVGNDSDGVFVEAQGAAEALAAFRRDLVAEAPPLARIDAVEAVELPPRDEAGFAIVESAARPGESTPVSPDVAVCDDCLRELFDPADRRYRYPFINCTNCGPRFTITRDVPYDRAATTMARFRMCGDCDREYHDPASRRFHAQPNACPRCGPSLSFVVAGRVDAAAEEALRRARDALAAGRVVAVKGVGGFHLACDATSDAAMATLRERKRRTDKPFAVLFASLEDARRYAAIDDDEARVLAGRERPIVLVRRRPDAALSGLVAPGNDFLGALLPYSPLHHLLVGDRPLVFTSANLGDEPIVKDNEEALSRLSGLADAYLMHDRDIHVVCDDSVVRCVGSREYPVRRSRGYAPLPVPLPRETAPVLGVGGELKATFCLARGDRAYLSQHVGDMASLETLAAFERAFAHFEALFRAPPAGVARDAHPGYLSSRWAADLARRRGLPLVDVQHHHAHVASLMAENGLDGSRRVLGVCFDGTGYGRDGAIWGGELLAADYRGFDRLAHLRYVPLPGGDAGVRRPYRAALAHLFAAGLPWDDDLPCVRACSAQERRVLRRQLERGVNCAPTSSVGRLFDAVAALIGVRQVVTYEAQAAIELEALAAEGEAGYTFGLGGDPLVVDPGEALREIVADLRAGAPREVIAGRFHQGLARMIVGLAVRGRERTGLAVVGLTGGVFQNVRLLGLARSGLGAEGFEVLVHQSVPPNDGGLALGQAAVAALG